MAARVGGKKPRSPTGGSSPTGTVRKLTVKGGSLRNSYLYLPLDYFPQDVIGGSNRAEELAERTIRVTFTPGRTVDSDIDGTKRILRARGAVSDFFARASLREGDVICIANTGPYEYEISKEANE